MNTYFLRKLRNLAPILIDPIIELITEKVSFHNSIYSLSEENIVITIHMSIVEEQMTVLEAENLKFKDQP